jgi:hypothetical protein
MEERLQHVLDVHALPCGAVVTGGGAAVARVGDFDALGGTELVSALLGPDGSPAATVADLSDQSPPDLWEQDDAFAFAVRAGPDVAVFVFGRGRGGWADRMRLSQAVRVSIREAFDDGGVP